MRCGIDFFVPDKEIDLFERHIVVITMSIDQQKCSYGYFKLDASFVQQSILLFNSYNAEIMPPNFRVNKLNMRRISLFIISTQTTESTVVKLETGDSRIKNPFMHKSDKQRQSRKGKRDQA